MFTAPNSSTKSPASPESDVIDPAVMVSMLEDHLVLRAPSDLDLETTELLVNAAASAVASGTTVMIDLDPDTPSAELMSHRPLRTDIANCVAGSGGPVAVLGVGYVRLTTRDALWTIDLANGRLCRSATAVEPHFIANANWTRITALWVAQASVTVLTDDGRYLSTSAGWRRSSNLVTGR